MSTDAEATAVPTGGTVARWSYLDELPPTEMRVERKSGCCKLYIWNPRTDSWWVVSLAEDKPNGS